RNVRLSEPAIAQVLPEERRKRFLAVDEAGRVGSFRRTAHRTLRVEQVSGGASVGGLSPRADQLLLERDGQLRRLAVDNPHPEISWSALWGKVWYESYDDP